MVGLVVVCGGERRQDTRQGRTRMMERERKTGKNNEIKERGRINKGRMKRDIEY